MVFPQKDKISFAKPHVSKTEKPKAIRSNWMSRKRSHEGYPKIANTPFFHEILEILCFFKIFPFAFATRSFFWFSMKIMLFALVTEAFFRFLTVNLLFGHRSFVRSLVLESQKRVSKKDLSEICMLARRFAGTWFTRSTDFTTGKPIRKISYILHFDMFDWFYEAVATHCCDHWFQYAKLNVTKPDTVRRNLQKRGENCTKPIQCHEAFVCLLMFHNQMRFRSDKTTYFSFFCPNLAKTLEFSDRTFLDFVSA